MLALVGSPKGFCKDEYEVYYLLFGLSVYAALNSSNTGFPGKKEPSKA